MTELGDIIMEGLHEIKRLQAGEETGARRHKMTDDQQIEAVARAIYQWWMDDMPPTGLPKIPYNEWIKSGDGGYFLRCAKAALEASHAQYVPMLVEALRFYERHHHVLNTTAPNYAREALANLPEELR